MQDSTDSAIRAHAAREFPREACGVVVVRRGREEYRPCRNIGDRPDEHFILHPEDYAAAEDRGAITAIVHSHPNLPATPSQADLVGCEASGLPWLIVSWPTGAMQRIEPSGYRAPLIGREFCHGVLDCYAIVRDYFAELGIALNDYERRSNWWNEGKNHYLDNFAREGFVRVSDESLRQHDLILMQMQSPVPNHAAVYLGGGLVLHHVMGRLSSRDVYGGYWRRNTWCVLRHRSLMEKE